MNEFYLCHIALVGARLSTFNDYGFHTRNDLSMYRVAPHLSLSSLESMSISEIRTSLAKDFPIWIHNIIADPEFPGRHDLAMPLRRFEGELKDSKDNEVISAVLSAGFKNRTLDPMALPDTMPLRQRCSMVINIDAWQEAYLGLENDILDILCANIPEIASWIKFASRPGNEIIDYSESA